MSEMRELLSFGRRAYLTVLGILFNIASMGRSILDKARARKVPRSPMLGSVCICKEIRASVLCVYQGISLLANVCTWRAHLCTALRRYGALQRYKILC